MKNKKILRFSGVGIQMGITIWIFAVLGRKLDKMQENSTAWWTLGLTLFAVIGSMVLLIKEIKKLGNEE